MSEAAQRAGADAPSLVTASSSDLADEHLEVGVDAPAPRPGGERRRALSGGMWNAASAVLPMASTLLLSVVIGRTLGKDALGSQSYIAYLTSLFVSLVIMSTVSASVQTLGAARGRDDPAELAWLSRLSTRAHLVAGTASGAALLLIGLVRADDVGAWVFAALTTVVDGAGWAMSSRIASHQGWSAVGARRLISQGASPLLGLIALGLGFGIPGVFAAQTIASVFLVLTLWPVMSRLPGGTTRGAVHPPLKALATLWGMNVLTAVVVQIVERRLEVVFLDAYSAVAEIAMYSVAFNLVSIAFYICSSGVGAAIPSIAAVAAAGDHERVAQSLRRAARVVVVFSVTAAAAIAAVGPALISWVYGAQFDAAAALVPWLCLSLVIAPVGHLMQSYWSGLATLRPVIASGVIGASVDVGVAFLAIPGHGSRGAVAANVAGQCTAAAVILFHTSRRTGRLGVPFALIARVAAVVLPAGVLARLVGGVGGPIGTFGGALSFCIVALLLTRVVRVVELSDLRWLLQALPQRVRPVVAWVGRGSSTDL